MKEKAAKPPQWLAIARGYARGVRDALPNTVKFLPYDTHRDAARSGLSQAD
jgi:hypothetical protein